MRMTYWNDKSIIFVKTECGKIVALNEWNGEQWFDCWSTTDGFDVVEDGLVVKEVSGEYIIC